MMMMTTMMMMMMMIFDNVGDENGNIERHLLTTSFRVSDDEI